MTTGVRGARRAKAILIAFACKPGAGSESGTGWAFVRCAAAVADVVVFTTPNEAGALSAAVASAQLSVEVRPVDIPSPVWFRLMPSAFHGLLKYCTWQWRVAAEIRQMERSGTVDVVHHVTFASDSLPTALLASRAPVRIWGPVGGAAPIIPGIFKYLTLKGVWREIARWVGTGILRRTTGKLVARHATLVLAFNNEVRDSVERSTSHVTLCAGIGIEPAELAAPRSTRRPVGNRDVRTALFAGRLLDWKGLLLAIQSLRYAPGWRLIVVGEGPHGVAAERTAERFGVANRVEFRGRVKRSELFGLYAEVDALLFPSFHDAGGWVAAEASALGCPVVCLDVGGPRLWAGKNAHVVQVRPAATLPLRLGTRLRDLGGAGTPEDGLHADRLFPLVERWYGQVGGSEEAGVGVG